MVKYANRILNKLYLLCPTPHGDTGAFLKGEVIDPSLYLLFREEGV